MRALFRVAVLTAVLLLAPATSSAVAAPLVPPGNSATNQYTETFPEPGGGVPSGKVKDGATPAKVLGPRNAAQLDALGPSGRAAAQLAAETAPERAPAAGKAGNVRGGANRGGQRGGGVEDPGGSSGLGQVLRQVTGTSGSSGMGIVLPLLIGLALIGSLAFLWRNRRTAQLRLRR